MGPKKDGEPGTEVQSGGQAPGSTASQGLGTLPFALSWYDRSGKPSTKGGLPLGLRGVAAWGGSGLGVFSLQIVANRFHRALHPLLPLSLPKAASL